MKQIFNQTFNVVVGLAMAALLSACGSSSTVSPFHPTRVIGLGDGYNDIRTAAGAQAPTVREGAGMTGSVVEQMAAYFGQSNVVSYASAGQRISDLATQITAVGNFSADDLVVITVGTFDVKAKATPSAEAQTLITQVQRLLDAGVKHVLIMPVLDVSRTPWGRSVNFDAAATNTFNNIVLTALNSAFGGHSSNPVIYANASGLTATFLMATSMTPFSPFTDTGYNGTAQGTLPACNNPTAFVGCDAGVANANYATMLFADGIHLTPAGNRWVAQYLFSATGQGWR